MTLEPLLWLHCSISGRCLLECMIGTQSCGTPLTRRCRATRNNLTTPPHHKTTPPPHHHRVSATSSLQRRLSDDFRQNYLNLLTPPCGTPRKHRCRATRNNLKGSNNFAGNLLKPRPGLACLICAEFAGQRLARTDSRIQTAHSNGGTTGVPRS